jgi:hypothetical protein
VHLVCISTTVPNSRVRLKLVHRVVCVCCVCVMSSSSSKSSSSSLGVRRCLLPSSLQRAIARADAAEKHARLAEKHAHDAMTDIAESRSHIRVYMAGNAQKQKKKDKKNRKKRKSVDTTKEVGKEKGGKDDNDKDDDGNGGEMPKTPDDVGAASVAAA